jgi:Protein of unknown function (DUF642)
MRAPLFVAIMLFFVGTSLHAVELLRNGGFERPITDDLSEDFQLNQQNIPGWEFSGGTVSLINHTRLLAGEGFQSLLLPCSADASASIHQEFNLDANGTVRISFKLAASKAVDGEIEIVLDDHSLKTIRLSEFWKPEEIALTDQMKWRLVELPQIQLSSGEHTLGFRVLQFQPRSDRQGDTRSSIQGVLIDAVSAQSAPFDIATTEQIKRPWPIEKKITYKADAPLPLDGLAGPWVGTRTLACYPSLANFYGAFRSTKELGGLQYLHFTGVGQPDGVLDAISLDGQPVFCDESRWYPYQVCTRTQTGFLDIQSTVRMVFADHGVLNQFTFTNQSDQSVTHILEMNLQSGQAVGRPDPRMVVIPGSLVRVYRFTIAPDQVITTNGEILAQWKISLPPHAGQEISVALAMEQSSGPAFLNAQRWGGDFAAAFAAAKAGWEKRWLAVFTPGNAIYSGCLPTLETDDQSLRELYYLSVVSLLETERDNFPEFKQCFVGEDPEWGGDVTWFWDYSLTSLPYALLNPAVMKNELRHWLTIDWQTCSHFSLIDGKPQGNWYAVNPYAYFLSLDRYMTVTGDFGFLTNKVNGNTVLNYMEALALDWKRLVPKDGQLADIGGNCWNMLEAPPNYIHTVASINAANIWMMRRLAEYEIHFGNLQKATRLRAEASALVPDLLKLYDPQTGSWNVLYPDGRQIDSRHIYDYLTVGTTISEDLSPDIKTGMINFVDRELMTTTWMRAMSRQDPSAFNSDRSDHGPAGSYTGWPAKAAQASAELGRFDKALDMFHRFREAFTSAIPQAIELTKVEGQDGLQARVSTRAGASFAEVSGSFAEVVINTFFGFRPAPDEQTALWNPQAPRGFNGRLLHVRWNGNLYTIVSDQQGLHIKME